MSRNCDTSSTDQLVGSRFGSLPLWLRDTWPAESTSLGITRSCCCGSKTGGGGVWLEEVVVVVMVVLVVEAEAPSVEVASAAAVVEATGTEAA